MNEDAIRSLKEQWEELMRSSSIDLKKANRIHSELVEFGENPDIEELLRLENIQAFKDFDSRKRTPLKYMR